MQRTPHRSNLGFLAIVCASVVAVLVPASASASFHLVRISEVYPGTAVIPDSAYVELQAFEAGQNQVGGHEVVLYDATGAPVHTATIALNAPNAQTQRTVLIADQFPPNAVTRDQYDPALGTNIRPAGGAACYETLDCVAWGNITPAGLAALPSPAGTPVATAGIPDGSSLTRSIAPACPTFFEGSDDTNDSSADFIVTTERTPRPNSVAPTEVVCASAGAPQTKITKGPS